MKKFVLTALLALAPAAAAQQTLTGAGASFPVPLYTKIFSEYQKVANVQVNYQSVGSGAGQRQIIAQTVDFAGSDAFLSNEQLASAPGGGPANRRILHIPTALAAVVPTYNLPGNPRVRFDGEALADIYLGNIRNWNDARLRQLNPNVDLPNLAITAVYRSDGSGTTSIFVDYLAKVSAEWRQKVSTGPQTAVKFPVGTGAPQNAGVAAAVKQTPGSIGYTEITYAKQNNLAIGLVRNSAGTFVDPNSLASVRAAAGGAPLPADARASITNTAARNGYPISGFTWLLVYRDQRYGNRTAADAKRLKDLLTWITSDNGGQQYNEALTYGRLDDVAQARARALINSMTYGGQAI